MNVPNISRSLSAIDLFCGAGGLSYGLKQAGISVKAGLDIDHACQFPFEHNIGGTYLKQDLSSTSSEDLKGYFTNADISILAGCAPCQPFSTLSNGRDGKQSSKWPLLREFTRIARDLVPDYVTMENVPSLRKQDVFSEFVNTLFSMGYYVEHKVLDAADYGVPQRRRRLILLASKHAPVRIATPAELGLSARTVRDAIQNLPPLSAGEADSIDNLHRSRNVTPLNLLRIRASVPGGTWTDWPEHLKLDCHKKPSGSTFKSVYGRLEWDKPSGTMTTQSYNIGTGRFTHPEQDRPLTLREMAILQSFPDDYKFIPDHKVPEFVPIGRMIGNAVPAALGYAIGRSILLNLEGK